MYNPTVIDNNGKSERAYDIYSRLLKDRIIFVGTAIDETVANSLFGSSAEALNKIVSVGESNYRVIGVFKDPNAGQSMSMSSGSALMANTQVASEFHSEEISTVYVYVPEVSRVNEVGIEAAKKLTQLSGARQGEYQILNMESMLEQYKQITGTMTGVIGAIAGISLFVGGIGYRADS